MYQPIPLKLMASVEKNRSSLSQWRRYFLPGLALACFATSTQGSPIDSTLFTTYTLGSNNTSVYWLVCGSTTESDGCYGDGTMGPFGKVGALLEGSPSYDDTTSTVTRAIYVVDVASGKNSADVDLYVYKKTDVISSTNDNVSVLLKDTITLPLKGGINALTFMAANSDYVFIGTNRTAYAVLVAKKGFAITQTPGFSPPLNVSAITADPYGFVTVTSGSFVTGATGFYTYPPNSTTYTEDGGGARLMLNTTQAVLPSTFK